jgi:hypothetical protein
MTPNFFRVSSRECECIYRSRTNIMQKNVIFSIRQRGSRNNHNEDLERSSCGLTFPTDKRSSPEGMPITLNMTLN